MAKLVKNLLHNIGLQSDRIKFDAQDGVAVRAGIADAIPRLSACVERNILNANLGEALFAFWAFAGWDLHDADSYTPLGG
jgi:hypothetical protein